MIIWEKILSWLSHPKIFQMMETRVLRIQYSVDGFLRTAIPLVGWKEGGFVPAERAEDIGLYFFVPIVMKIFNLDVRHGIIVFIGGMIFVSFLSGLVGFGLLYRS